MNSKSTENVDSTSSKKLSIKQTNSIDTTATVSEEKDEFTDQINFIDSSPLFTHDAQTILNNNLNKLNQQINPNHSTADASQFNSSTPNIDNLLPTDSLPFLQNSINQLDSLLLTSEKDRPKRVTINVGGVKHEGDSDL